MSDPTSFTSSTPRFGLPFLFSGQAQKEVSVNEAHALADMLLTPASLANWLLRPLLLRQEIAGLSAQGNR